MRRGLRAGQDWLAGVVAQNRPRAGLWLPVAFGAGIFSYFELLTEPPLYVGPALFGFLALLLAITRRSVVCVFCLIPLLAAVAGFSAAQFRTWQVAAPVLKREIAISLTGMVEEVRATSRGERLIVRVEQFGRIALEDRPGRVRLLLLKRDRAPSAGSRITVFGRFRPTPPPVAPHAFDFQRALYFGGVGAVGFALGPLTVEAAGEVPLSGRLSALRSDLSERIRSRLPGDTGALAAALLVGDRDWISEGATEAMRDAGIAHLLAISGLHMGLVAGCVFFFIRLLLSLHPAIALRWPTRRMAATGAILFATVYLLLSGASVPTQRAYVMTVVVLIGVVIGRRAISMRLIASAAAIIMAARPEYVLGASFQLSFAAVICLVAIYETGTWSMYPARGQLFGGFTRHVGLLALSSFVASSATLPLALYHFQKAALYGVATNLLAVPAASLWIMPFGAAALILMPFGFEGLALVPMGWGIDGVLQLARVVQGWPYATHAVAAAPGWVMGLTAFSGLWLCLSRGRIRFGAVPVLVVCMGVLVASPWVPPTLVIADRAKMVGVFSGAGIVSTSRHSGFAVDVWRRRAGVLDAQGDEPAAPSRFHCDSLGCAMDAPRIGSVAWSSDAQSLAEDCRRADILVTRVRVPDICPMPRLILGPKQIRAGGSIAIWLDKPVPKVVYSRQIQGNRPWSRGIARSRNKTN
ncbi:ComEC/Rec2 family competence protein [Nisaea sp.]|uniref:ComEC/Rec2 family competence protein n=1 Tax=Nisaea sp. TaxID=2024842 RepID=UPI002B266C4A|nr:ComEC/Rec2 family competence protein [Nisaea sp.]